MQQLKKFHKYIKYIVTVMIFSATFFLCGILFFPICGVGEFGTLLAGTVGVGASISAMIAVIATLKEQQKVNNQKDLLDALNLTFERFADLSESQCENDLSESQDEKKSIKDHLEKIWETKEGIQNNLDILNSNRIGMDTYKGIQILRECAKDKYLIKVGKLLDELYIIKGDAENKDSYSISRVLQKCNDIHPVWIKYAAFYLNWNYKEHNNKIVNDIRANAFIKKPSDIPIVKMEPGEIYPFDEKIDTPFIGLISESYDCLEISRIEIHFKSKKRSFTNECPVHIRIKKSNYFSFKMLFEDKTDDIVNFVLENKKIDIDAELNLWMKYKNEEWIYEEKLSFYEIDNCKYLRFSEFT